MSADALGAAWEGAQRLWGVRLRDPVVAEHDEAAALAWFTFPGQVHVDLAGLAEFGATEHVESLLAHEIGHHVLAPGTPLVGHKVRHQMARAVLASSDYWRRGRRQLREIADQLANIFLDALVNTRVVELQLKRALDPFPPLARLVKATNPGTLSEHGPIFSAAWWAVLRMDELLWSLPSGWLCGDLYARPKEEAAPGADASEREQLQHELDQLRRVPPELVAQLLADVVKSHRTDPVGGALAFGLVLAPLWLDLYDQPGAEEQGPDFGCGHGATGPTAAELDLVLADPRLSEEPVHPLDKLLGKAKPPGHGAQSATRQALGLAETLLIHQPADQDAAIRSWYRNLARPWVVALRQLAQAPLEAAERIPGGLATWELGEELDEIDWPGTFASGPTVVVGVTTRRREEIPDVPPPELRRVELDLYVDGSGSMPRPDRGAQSILAGTILVLSVLRGGGTVRVTSFSSPGQVAGTEGYTRDPDRALDALLQFFNGGTTFPLDLYEERYLRVPASSPEGRHVVALSDDGLCSMFGCQQPGLEHIASAARARLDTATLLLIRPTEHALGMAQEAGYRVIRLNSMDDAPKACQQLAEELLLPPARRAALTSARRSGGG